MTEKQIGDVIDFVRNGASIKQANGKGGYPITRIETIWNQTIDTDRFGYADIGDNELNTYKKYLMKGGDLLMSHINSPKHLGKCAIYEGVPSHLIHGMNLLCLRAKENVSEPKYLKYFFNSNFFKIQLRKISNHSVNQASFSAGNLKKLNIPLPHLDQQKKIAAILDAADAYKQKTKALIEKYDELTQSLFLEMFGDPFVNQYNHAYVKLESLVKKKSDLVDGPFGSSVNTKVDYIENGEIPVIRTKNIGINNRFNSDDLKFMTRKKYETVIRSKVLPGDILLSKVGTIGNTCIFPDDYKEAVLSTTGSCRIRLDEDKINKTFFLNYLNFYRNKMLEIASAGVQAFLNMKHIKGFDILIPALDLQSQFAERVQAIEAQKAQAEDSLTQAEDLFNSLLQRAFKGELTS